MRKSIVFIFCVSFMKNLIFRLFFIILSGLLIFAYVFPWSSYDIEVPFTGSEYKLWLDLQGWIELDYKVDLTEAKQEEDYDSERKNAILEGLKSIIDKRVESLNINDSVITTASYADEEHIIVQIPLKWNSSFENSENIQRAKEAIWKVVQIEFKELKWEITDEDTQARWELAQLILDEIQQEDNDFWVSAQKFEITAENIEIWESWSIKSLFRVDELKTHEIIETQSGYLILWDLQEEQNYKYIFISNSPSQWKPAADNEWRILNDKYFVNSSVQYDEAFNPMIELVFNEDGAEIFWELTTRLVNQPIAIFVWWELLTSPTVNQSILTGKAVITGSYTPAEAKSLSTEINTWVVPAPIILTSEKTIDSKIGWESLEKLVIAWIAWFAIIFIFLIFIYRLSGLIASIALLLYVMIILAIIKTFWIILTLASIAGLILSIGMAIDANILIFERIKVEIKKGKKLMDATAIWFKQSWTAIWDSNFTWFIVAMILFIFWINLIKGFGLMLALGIIVSLFSAMWISRVLLILLAQAVKDKTNFIWIKK